MDTQLLSRPVRDGFPRRRERSSPITKPRFVGKISRGASRKLAKDLDKFPFDKLPAELRLKIWSFSLPDPRLVSIQCGSDMSSMSDPKASNVNKGCTTPTPLPGSLHTCVESRAQTVKFYRPYFGFFRNPGSVWFNFDHDIMYFGPREGFMAADSQFHTCMLLCDPAELASVRRMAVNDALFWTGDTYNSRAAASFTLEVLKKVATRMTGLEELFFVLWEDETDIDEAVKHERMTKQIQTGMQSVNKIYPAWEPPSWKVVSLDELPGLPNTTG